MVCSFDKKKRDDVADAMLLALYWAEKKAPGTKSAPKSVSAKLRAKQKEGKNAKEYLMAVLQKYMLVWIIALFCVLWFGRCGLE